MALHLYTGFPCMFLHVFRACDSLWSVVQMCVAEDGELAWTLYDAGPRTIQCPLLFLPPVSGRADVFFRQMLALSGLGYRVISVCILLYH